MSVTAEAVDRFRHEAFLYSGWAEFIAGTVPFIKDGIEAGEPVLVVESPEKIDLLRAALGGDADRVLFADMAQVGANPARIIPAWRDFVTRYGTENTRLRESGNQSGTEGPPTSWSSASATNRCSTSPSGRGRPGRCSVHMTSHTSIRP